MKTLLVAVALFIVAAHVCVADGEIPVVKNAAIGVRSQTLTLIGDGSGALGEFCGGSIYDGNSDCSCLVQWTAAEGTVNETVLDSEDFGPDLLRCRIAHGIGSDVKVSVLFLSSSVRSNFLNVRVPDPKVTYTHR